jgi:hypothetical protein
VNLIADRLVLTDIGSGTDKEVIGEAGDFAKVQNYDVERFFRLCGSNRIEPVRFRDFRGLFCCVYSREVLVLPADSALLPLSYYNTGSASIEGPDRYYCLCAAPFRGTS